MAWALRRWGVCRYNRWYGGAAMVTVMEAYELWAETYDADPNRTRDLDRQVTRERLGGRRWGRIVEIGCGTGKNTGFLAGIGTAVHALDFSANMMDRAREKVSADNVRFSLADLTETWPCASGASDLVVCNLVLEHIADLDHVFGEAARVLAADGRFFVCELHPFRQYKGTVARFDRAEGRTTIPAYAHHISDFLGAGEWHGLRLASLQEWWHEADAGKLPRLVSFMFAKDEATAVGPSTIRGEE